jgi:hypothetical protein
MIICLGKHKHLIFLKRERWFLSKFLFELKGVKIRVSHHSRVTTPLQLRDLAPAQPPKHPNPGGTPASVADTNMLDLKPPLPPYVQPNKDP